MFVAEQIYRGRIRRKVSLVLQIIDNFTESVIPTSGIVALCLQTGERAFCKRDGYLIFTFPIPSNAQISVKAPLYNSEILDMDGETLSAELPMLRLRLVPNRSYGLPHGTTCVYGKALAGQEVILVNRQEQKPFRLLHDYEKGSESIRIFHPNTLDLQGRQLALCNKGEEALEFCRLLKEIEGELGHYRLSRPLENSYKKAPTLLLTVHSAHADNWGEYFIPIGGSAGEGVSGHLLLRDLSRYEAVEFESGKRYCIDMLPFEKETKKQRGKG